MMFLIEVSHYAHTYDDKIKEKVGWQFKQEKHFVYLPDNSPFYDEVKRTPMTPEEYLTSRIKPVYNDIIAFTVTRV